MKKILFSLFYVFFCILASSQEGEIRFQGNYDPLVFPFRNFEFHANRYSYIVGGLIDYSLTKTVSAGIGLSYEFDHFLVLYGAGTSLARELEKEKHFYKYLIFPIQFDFLIFSKGKGKILLSSNLDLSLLKSEEIDYYYDDGTVIDGYDFEFVEESLVHFSIGPKFRMGLGNHFYSSICPKARTCLNSKNESYSWSILFQIAFGYRFSSI